jgi:hypothetical protein
LQVLLLCLCESFDLLDEAVLQISMQEVQLVVFLHALLVGSCRSNLNLFESKDAVLGVLDLSRDGGNLLLDGHSSFLVGFFIETNRACLAVVLHDL